MFRKFFKKDQKPIEVKLSVDLVKQYLELNLSKVELANLGNNLLVKYGDPDWAKVTFAQLKDYVYLNDTDKTQTFFDECLVLSESLVLKKIKDEMLVEMKEYLLTQSSGFDMNFKRGEISGLIRFFDQIDRYATQSTKQRDDEDVVFDVHDI